MKKVGCAVKVNETLEILKDHGLKITNQRKTILEILAENDQKLLTADEILELVKQRGATLNLTTVYRNLEPLTNLGIIHKLVLKDQITYYKLNCLDHHHHHLICENCGGITPIEHCPLDELLPEAKKHNFKIKSHNLEVYGICDRCRKN